MESVYSAGENIGAPGGPLFVPGLISERMNVAQFRHRCLELIEDLMVELEDLELDDDDSDLLVNDLKGVTDAQLVNALAETDGGDLVNADKNQIVVMEPEIHPHQPVHPYPTLMYGDQNCPTIESEDPPTGNQNFVLASGQIASINSPGGSLETWGLTMQVDLFAEATGIREVDHANLETKEDLHGDTQRFDLENALQCEINNENTDIFNTTVVKDQIAEKTEAELLKLSPKAILGNENPSLNSEVRNSNEIQNQMSQHNEGEKPMEMPYSSLMAMACDDVDEVELQKVTDSDWCNGGIQRFGTGSSTLSLLNTSCSANSVQRTNEGEDTNQCIGLPNDAVNGGAEPMAFAASVSYAGESFSHTIAGGVNDNGEASQPLINMSYSYVELQNSNVGEANARCSTSVDENMNLLDRQVVKQLPQGKLKSLASALEAETHTKNVGSSKKKKKKKATKKNMRQLKKGKPRGRPRDREVRAAALKDANREAALVLLRRERAAARENAPLRCLHLVEKTKGAALGHDQKLQLSFLTSLPKASGDSNPNNPFEPVDPSEVLLCVEFYSSRGRLSKAQEFLVLGSQPLTALRDKLYCLTDELARHAKLEVPSGYFLIENVFYNDLRHPEATDYSRPILDWLQAGEKEVARKWKSLGGSKPQPILNDGDQPCSNDIPTFKAASMSETCFQDINCRLGEGYLYCHQGNCKHSLIVRDMRLIHPEDIQNKHAYPLIRDQQSLRHRKCSICDIYRAKMVTYDDKLAPQSPCFFCQNCYYMLHYSESGMLIYDDFKVYDYFHE